MARGRALAVVLSDAGGATPAGPPTSPGAWRAGPDRAGPDGNMLGMIKNSLLSTVETWPYRVLSKGVKVGGGAGGR